MMLSGCIVGIEIGMLSRAWSKYRVKCGQLCHGLGHRPCAGIAAVHCFAVSAIFLFWDANHAADYDRLELLVTNQAIYGLH
jgi:hypothetical protein